MNSIEWQVTSLDLSRKLKELGVKQNSIFFWLGGELRNNIFDNQDNYKDSFSAFTVAELWEKLPYRLDADRITSFLVMKKVEQNDGTGKLNTILNYEMISGTIYPWCQNESNPANACAKMLIRLIESGSVKP